MPRRPNILFLFSDQQRYDALGILNPHIKTPNLDRLARSGLLLTRAYPPTPVSLPCRASLITGQYPSTHGATFNHAPLHQDYAPNFATLLNEQGYFTHIVGKSHVNNCHDPLSPESAPQIFNYEYYRGWHGPWYGFQRADLAIGHSTEKHACGMHYGAWLEEQGIEPKKYFGHTAYEAFGRWELPEAYHNSRWTADVTIESIHRCAEREQPFYIWANFQDPHNPCMVPEPWASMYNPASLPRYGFKPGEPDCLKNKPPFYDEIRAHPGAYAAQWADPEMPGACNVSALDWTPEQVQQNAACYYAMISLMDYHIGRILDALEASGQRENTLIVFSSDHGDLLGDHGVFWKGIFAYEEAQRVPLIVSYPGRIPQNVQSDAIQNLIDLPATFLAVSGAPLDWRMEGINQLPTWLDPQNTRVRSDTVIEQRPFETEWNQRTLVEQRYKLVFYANRTYGELYDLEQDPNQINNLWTRADYVDLKQSMIARLLSCEMNKSKPNWSLGKRMAK